MAFISNMFFIGCAFLLCLIHNGNSEIFTALNHLEKVFHAESNLATTIRGYIDMEQARLERLRNLADDYEKHSTEALQDVAGHVGNPVNAFLVVKRFTSNWNQVESLIRNNTAETFFQSLADISQTFPGEEDLEGAATALLRLQDTYALSTKNLARGEIQGVKQSSELTAEDCFELGRVAYTKGDHYHTVLWMEQALEMMDKNVMTPDHLLTLDYLSFSVFMQGQLDHAAELTRTLLEHEPGHERAQNNLHYYEKLIAEKKQKGDIGDDEEEEENPVAEDNYHLSDEYKTYERLCRGEDTHDIPGKNTLSCQYAKPHPYFILRPLKEEHIYYDPQIKIYHDILVDSEVNKVIELAAPKLQRATVQNPQTGILETASYRVSKSAWLTDAEHHLINHITQKVQAITHLSMETAEELQVVNYGIGGQYEPHYDFAREWEQTDFTRERGNRLCTAIYYMTDVEAGGATVFPTIGVKLWPVKGQLAVWYNLRKSGAGDFNTRHAGCPVLTGNKWICNKWLHERGQEFVRPCSLNPLD